MAVNFKDGGVTLVVTKSGGGTKRHHCRIFGHF